MQQQDGGGQSSEGTGRIAVLDDYQDVAKELGNWDALGAETVFFQRHVPDQAELIRSLAGFEVVVAMRERTSFPRPVLEELADLRLLVTTGMVNASIDLQAARDCGIMVCGTDSPGYPAAELTMAFILALARGLVDEVESVRSGGWQAGLGRSLEGSTLGLVGVGRLGARVGSLARPFGMVTLGWSQNLTSDQAAAAGVTPVSKRELLQASDFVSIHLKLSERTSGLIAAPDLALMKETSYLVNTSRGPIVDEMALLQAVRSGSIAGAAVDVYDHEPLPRDHPFRDEQRILTTPHIGYVTHQTYEAFYGGAVEAIAAWRSGAPVRVLA